MIPRDIIAYYFYQKHNKLHPFSDEVIAAATAHARACYPHEACGIVAGGMFHPMENRSGTPDKAFLIADQEQLAMRERYGKLDGLIHSHTNGYMQPSKEDMVRQIASGITWGIIVLDRVAIRDIFFWGDDVRIAPYEGRPFKFGVYDCYALGRDWFRKERGILLPNVAREDLFWQNGGNLMMELYKDVGFYDISFSELRPGDAVIGKGPLDQVPSHCGVILDNGIMLHHPYGTPQKPRLSVREPALRWKPYLTHCLRHKDATL